MKTFLHNRRAMTGLGLLVFFAIVAIFSSSIAPYSPTDINFTPMLGFSAKHLLGSTPQGQDIFSQLVYGTRDSLLVGVVTAAIITAIQLVTGVFAGYIGGWIDGLFSAVTNIFLVLPGLVLLIVITSYVSSKGLPEIIAVLAITGWAWGARVLRSQAMSLRDRPYIEAARMSGERRWRIVVAHVVPNMSGILLANFFGAALYAILGEAGLDFLGLGNINEVSWGSMLYWAQSGNALLLGEWAYLLFPGVCILLLGTGFGLLNFAVDEISDPRLRGF
ncbi:MAG TPA: ABC transporter permease [Streptosporangiaceae bacterium]|nr:ABC transporter permease [Streptosporangiaceae bacterium]